MTVTIDRPHAIVVNPGGEAARLSAVRRYGILDTPPDGSFDKIAALAASLFSVPISIVSLVDHDRIWFKAHHGVEVQQIGRDPGLCASAIMQSEPWILTDAKVDPRSLTNPLVAGEFGLRFYVGVPLRTTDGFNLGTLCVIDREPRPVTEQQIAQLTNLAAVVMDQMELRLSARRAIEELSETVAQREAALRRSEIVAKEIDHRVMNSLQLVSALLTLQGRGLGQSQGADQLKMAARRVSAVARVHQHIYLSEGVESAACKEYLKRLCSDLSGVLRWEGESGIEVESIDAAIPTERIVPLGLIVNELVTNAAKYGGGRITVAFDRASTGYALSVSDEGAGLPEDFDPTSTSGLGMKVISALVQQLGGTLLVGRTERPRGATFTVLFPDTSQPRLN